LVEAAAVVCPACGAPDEGTASCRSCGLLLRRGGGPVEAAPFPRVAARPAPRAVEPAPAPVDRAWPYLAAGVVLAPVLTLTPILRYIGWFLASLVHESGHCAMSWALGCPAFPAIRLDGHAAAIHGPQQILVAGAVWVALAALAWKVRSRGGWFVGAVAAAAVHPVLVLVEGAREAAFLLAGHLGELAFATVFLWRAGTGGFTSSRVERGLYAVLGLYLVGRNAWLAGGLVWSDDTRAAYATNGSFGMENDYTRLAREVLGGSTEAVALAMLAVTVATLGIAWALARAFPASDR
jgi:hypothetical protein